MSNLGLTKEDFHAITWFTSWAVDAHHGSDLDGIDGSRKIELMYRLTLAVICFFHVILLFGGSGGWTAGLYPHKKTTNLLKFSAYKWIRISHHKD